MFIITLVVISILKITNPRNINIYEYTNLILNCFFAKKNSFLPHTAMIFIKLHAKRRTKKYQLLTGMSQFFFMRMQITFIFLKQIQKLSDLGYKVLLHPPFLLDVFGTYYSLAKYFELVLKK